MSNWDKCVSDKSSGGTSSKLTQTQHKSKANQVKSKSSCRKVKN